MSGSAKSPLTRLVLFMVFLSVAGSIIAGAHFLLVDQPHQLQPPTNAICSDDCMDDYNYCTQHCSGSACDRCWRSVNTCCMEDL